MKPNKSLVSVNGLNWQQCEDDHKLILHREKICPLCQFSLNVECAMNDCFSEVFPVNNKE